MRRRLRESVSDDVITTAIYDHFRSGYVSDDFLGVVENILGRIDDFTDDDEIMSAVDDALIYDDDQWDVMKHYQRPSEANFDEAIEYLIDDIYSIANRIAESLEVEDEDEELEEKFSRNTRRNKMGEKFNTRSRRLKESRRKLREGRRNYDLWDTVYGDLTMNGDQKNGKYTTGLGYDEEKVTTDFDGNIVVYGNSEAELNPVIDVANKHSLKTSGVVASKSRYGIAPFSITVYIPQAIGVGKPSNNLELPNKTALPRYTNGMSLKGKKFGKPMPKYST